MRSSLPSLVLVACAGTALGFAPTPLRPCAACRTSSRPLFMDIEVSDTPRSKVTRGVQKEPCCKNWATIAWRAPRATPRTLRPYMTLSLSNLRPGSPPQEIEFIIHPDGRVEERVLGVKGMACESLTLEINKALGEVYESKPTTEMFEQKVELSVDAENTVSENAWGNGADSWGSSDSSDGGSGGNSW